MGIAQPLLLFPFGLSNHAIRYLAAGGLTGKYCLAQAQAEMGVLAVLQSLLE